MEQFMLYTSNSKWQSFKNGVFHSEVTKSEVRSSERDYKKELINDERGTVLIVDR